MSHVISCKIRVRDLEAMKLAAAECGLEFREGQQTYKWYGRWVGDYKMPAGMTKEQLGKCDHALSVVGNSGAYEIGLVQTEDGEYQLLYDFWSGGYGLEQKVGKRCEKLMQAYSCHAAKRKAVQLGWSVSSETVQEDGSIALEFEPQRQNAWAGSAGGGW